MKTTLKKWKGEICISQFSQLYTVCSLLVYYIVIACVLGIRVGI